MLLDFCHFYPKGSLWLQNSILQRIMKHWGFKASKDSGLGIATLFIILKAEAAYLRGAVPHSDQSEIKRVFFIFFRERSAKNLKLAWIITLESDGEAWFRKVEIHIWYLGIIWEPPLEGYITLAKSVMVAFLGKAGRGLIWKMWRKKSRSVIPPWICHWREKWKGEQGPGISTRQIRSAPVPWN